MTVDEFIATQVIPYDYNNPADTEETVEPGGPELDRCPDCGDTEWDNECCDQYKIYQGDGTFITVDWNA